MLQRWNILPVIFTALVLTGCDAGISTLSTTLTATANPAVDVARLGRRVAIVSVDLPAQGIFGLSGPAHGTEALYRLLLATELQQRGYQLTDSAAQADLLVRLTVRDNRMERAYWTAGYTLDMFRYPSGTQRQDSDRIAVFSSQVSVGYVPNRCASTPRVAARSVGLLFETFPQGGQREQTIDMKPGC